MVTKRIKIGLLNILLLPLLLLPQISLADSSFGIQTKTSGCFANQVLPDSACTPGAVFTVDTRTICTPGYTKTVRNVSIAIKKKVFQEYDISWTKRGNYEVDHLISLELGGSNAISNLFPESYLIKNGARVKDSFENYLHRQVCTGNLSIEEAQKEIATDWFGYATERGKAKTTNTKSFNPLPQIKIENPKPTPKIPNEESTDVKVPDAPPAASNNTGATTGHLPSGESVNPPTHSSDNSIPAGATARCKDGTYSLSVSRSGTCSHHGGVSTWL